MEQSRILKQQQSGYQTAEPDQHPGSSSQLSNVRDDRGCGLPAGPCWQCLLCLLTGLIVNVDAASVQLVHRSFSVFMLSAYTFAGIVVLSTVLLSAKRQLPHVTRKELAPSLLHVTLRVMTTLAFYTAVKHTQIDGLVCIDRVFTFMGAAIFGRIFLRDKCLLINVLCIGMGLVGCVLVIQPWDADNWRKMKQPAVVMTMHFHNRSSWFRNRNDTQDFGGQEGKQLLHSLMSILGYCAAALTGLVSALASVIQRKYLPTTAPETLLLYSGLAGTVISLITVVVMHSFNLPNSEQMTFIALHMCMSTIVVSFVVKYNLFVPLETPRYSYLVTSASYMIFATVAQHTVLSDVFVYNSNWLEYFGIVIVKFSIISILPAYYVCQALINRQRKASLTEMKAILIPKMRTSIPKPMPYVEKKKGKKNKSLQDSDFTSYSS